MQENKNSLVVVIGPFPPPIHGMAKNLKLVAEDISELTEVFTIDISPGSLNRGFSYHALKLAKVLWGVLRAAIVFSRARSLYMPPDAGLGMAYTLLFVSIAKMYGLKIYLHHRSFKYINKRSTMMTVVQAIGNGAIENIFLCSCMKNEFSKIYGLSAASIVSNAVYLPKDEVEIRSYRGGNDVLVIGFLSNISFDKGIREVVDAYIESKNIGVPCRLIIGGAYSDSLAKKFVERIVENGGDIEYVGFVSDKKSFFRKLDVFLFPTKYENEAQPNVVFEAAYYGVPVFSVDRACIRDDLSRERGFLLPIANFGSSVAERLLDFSRNSASLNELKLSAHQSLVFECQEAAASYRLLLERIAQRNAFVSDGVV